MLLNYSLIILITCSILVDLVDSWNWTLALVTPKSLNAIYQEKRGTVLTVWGNHNLLLAVGTIGFVY